LGSLFVVPWTTPERGRDFWSGEIRCRMMLNMYRKLNPAQAKEPSSRSSHGSSIWIIVGKWISFVNQMKRSEIITVGVVYLGSKHIPVKNCTEIPPRKHAGGMHNWGNSGNTTKMNRQISGTVSAEEHKNMVNTIQTLQIQLKALST
jgi:hypothetical protein